MRSARIFVLAAVAWMAGCGASQAGPSTTTVTATPSTEAPPGAPARTWQSPIAREHPLVGRIFGVRENAFVEEQTLVNALLAAHWVLLGEKHDNADHHVLEHALAEQVAARRPRVALALEMITSDRQTVVDAARTAGPDEIARAVEWEASGWPSFAMYRPLVELATSRGLAIVAANLPNAMLMPIARGAPLDDPLIAALAARTPPTDHALVEPIAAEMRAAHCGMLPEHAVPGMVRVQWLRDAMMAERMVAADTGDGAVLVAGAEHARADRGVPHHLGRLRATGRIATVAFTEVDPAQTDPGGYAAHWETPAPPFDYLWFTPIATNEDPCTELRAHGMHR